MIVKTPGSQMGSPAAAEEGGEEVGGGRWESGERSEVQTRSTLTSTAPKANKNSGATDPPRPSHHLFHPFDWVTRDSKSFWTHGMSMSRCRPRKYRVCIEPQICSSRNRIWRRFRVFCLMSVNVCSWYKTHSNTGILAGVRYVFFLSVPGFQFGPVTVSFEAFSGHKTMMYTLKVGFIIVNLILQTVSRN